jgi:hypothetical protein
MLVLPSNIDHISLGLNSNLQPEYDNGLRYVYFEASKDGGTDREGEDIAVEALWKSKDLFLSQGYFDINHFAWLGNPTGTGMRPEYIIGTNPTQVKRQGKSLFVAGSIFSSNSAPPESFNLSMGGKGSEVKPNIYWANMFWHSITALKPPMRWFPSVFGRIDRSAAKLETRDGVSVRVFDASTKIEWFAVGFAMRAVNPDLPAVSAEPMGPLKKEKSGEIMAKAVSSSLPIINSNVAYMSMDVFGKAMSNPQGQGPDIVNDAVMNNKNGLNDVAAVQQPTKELTLDFLTKDILARVAHRTLEGSIGAISKHLTQYGFTPEQAKKLAVMIGRKLEATFQGADSTPQNAANKSYK